MEARGWRFCFIGGPAVLRWGEPRFTRHIDLTLLCPFGSEDEISEPLLESGYRGRIPDAREFARRSRVLLLESAGGIPIDITLAALPFEESAVARSSLFELEPGCALRTCSGEDLIVTPKIARFIRSTTRSGSFEFATAVLHWTPSLAYFQNAAPTE